MTLRELTAGRSARIEEVGGEGALRQHFLDMGVIPGAEITLVKLAPMGDPMELRIHGYELTLRLADAEKIRVTPLQETPESPAAERSREQTEHPGLGEEGKFHPPGTGTPLPEDETLTFALVGNQNCGKTTLFNQLTGSNQHVGNFPGVTVDRKDGVIRGHANTLITDLPGIYSMSPYSREELVSRDFVLKQKPKAIINIVDATNIERNLYLTMQLLEMNIPTVVALNMMDELTGNGGTVDVNAMEAMLGVPVVPISASKNQGVDELVRHAVHIARYQEKPLRQDFCDAEDHGGAVHRALHAVSHLIEDHAERAGLPVRFSASKLIEGDAGILEQLDLDQNERELLDHIILQMENERGLDRAAAMADMRFDYIGRVSERCVVKPRVNREQERSQRIDSVLTGRFTAIPMFILIMGLVFYLTFFLIGPFFQELLSQGIGALGALAARGMEAAHVNAAVQSLVLDGVFEGVGSVVSFLPLIVILFFFLSLLEDSGYIARVAFFMDKLLRKIGLSGRSIVPMLIGFGCTVPAVMSTRTLPSDRDRRMTILLTPFMSCTAELPDHHGPVSAGRRGRHSDSVAVQEHALSRRGRPLRDGAAALPPAESEKRPAPALGEGPGLPAARLLGHFDRHHRGVVPQKLRLPLRLRHRLADQHPLGHRGPARAGHAARWPGRLAHRDLADQRLHGQGERGVRDADALRRRRRHGAVEADGGLAAGVQPALHPLRRGHRLDPPGARTPLGRSRRALAVRSRVARRPAGAHARPLLRPAIGEGL